MLWSDEKAKKSMAIQKSYPALKMKKGKPASSQPNFKAAKSLCRKKLMHQSCSLYNLELKLCYAKML